MIRIGQGRWPVRERAADLKREVCATGLDGAEQERQCGLKIDRVRLPADPRARI